jgi:transcriptional regulator with XRE-family HTH domain
MSLEPSPDVKPDSVQAYFAWLLKHLRMAAGMTQTELAVATHFSGSLIAQIETMRKSPTLPFAVRCDKALKTGGIFARLWPLMHRGALPGWFPGFAGLEGKAVVCRIYDSQFVPGIFQTEDYARTVIIDGCGPHETPEDIEMRLNFRMQRQRVLAKPSPAIHWAILDETILRRPVGSRSIMRAQLQRLIEVTDMPRTFLQILPFSAGHHPGMLGPMMIFTYGDGHELVYSEVLDFGYVVSDAQKVARYALDYDRLRAQALPTAASLDLLKTAMEDL